MKLGLAVLTTALLSFATVAHADEPPPARRGFQLALRTGIALPVGSVSPTTKMSDALGVQVPLIVDLGAKVIPNLWVGGFLGIAVGGVVGRTEQVCTQVGVNCTGVGFRGGIMGQWSFRPKELVNPWVGLGFGYELATSSGSNDPNSVSNSIHGFELVHVLGGVDFRLQDLFGVGPFFDAALGRYDYAKQEVNAGGAVTDNGGSLPDKSFHGWLIFGVRAVMFP